MGLSSLHDIQLPFSAKCLRPRHTAHPTLTVTLICMSCCFCHQQHVLNDMSTDVNVILVYSEHVPSLLSCPSVAIFINAQLINPLCFAFPQEPRVAVAIHLDKHSFKQKAEVYWA